MFARLGTDRPVRRLGDNLRFDTRGVVHGDRVLQRRRDQDVALEFEADVSIWQIFGAREVEDRAGLAPVLHQRFHIDATGLGDRAFVLYGADDDGTPTGPGPDIHEPPDTTNPATTIDLHTAAPTSGSLALVWTAPGDDGEDGTAKRYDIRFLNQPIDESNWNQATPLDSAIIPTPKEGKQIETIVLVGLDSGSLYAFALKTVDDADLWSELSNCATGRTGDERIPPSAVRDLEATAIDQTRFELTWTAPGDDYMTGQATSYEIRHSPNPIVDEMAWDAATPLESAPSPKTTGEEETFVATGLTPGRSYFFGLKTSDELGNVSDVSNPAPALGVGVDLWLSPKQVRHGQQVYMFYRAETEETLKISLYSDVGWISCSYTVYRLEILADETFPPGVYKFVDDYYDEDTKEYLPPAYYIILFCRQDEEITREWFQVVE